MIDVNGNLVAQSVSYLGQGFEQKKLEIQLERKKFPKPKPKYTIMNEETYEINLKYCVIRPNKNSNFVRAETPWTVEIGIFKEYLREQKITLIDKCFE